jgi:hypothetical protein
MNFRSFAVRGRFKFHDVHEGGGGQVAHRDRQPDLCVREGERPLPSPLALRRQAGGVVGGGRGHVQRGQAYAEIEVHDKLLLLTNFFSLTIYFIHKLTWIYVKKTHKLSKKLI